MSQERVELRQWQMGPHFDQDCLAVQVLNPLFKLKSHVRNLEELGLGHLMGLFAPPLDRASLCVSLIVLLRAGA